MSPKRLSQDLVRTAPVVRHDDTIEHAIRLILDSGLPALPVVRGDGRLLGIFGEREFMTALFPGYVGQLSHAGFVRSALDETIERRVTCLPAPVGKHTNTEHVDVESDFSDLEIAEIFLHHRVLIVPVVERREVVGVITRSDFFRRIAERVLGAA